MRNNKIIAKEERMFRYDPIWKTLVKLSLPSLIMMLVMGSYFFFDNVLSINLAGDVYNSPEYHVPGINGPSLVRIFMNGYSPINSLMIALALLFGVGTATRSAINMGKGDKERAKKTITTGVMSSIILAIIATPIIILISQSWIESQYNSMSSSARTIIGDNAFKYAWPVILSFPMIMFNQMIPSLLRNEARTNQMMVAIIFPIFINLLLDWVFMGPMGMGVEGGAWATFTSNAITTFILMFWISKSNKTSLLRWDILFGKNIKLIAIFVIILVGIAPFLRNIAQSVTSSIQTNIINDVSSKVFRDDYTKYWDINRAHWQEMLASGYRGDPSVLGLLHDQSKYQDGLTTWNNLWKGLGFQNEPTYDVMAAKIITFMPSEISNWNAPIPTSKDPKDIMAALVTFKFINNLITSQATSGMVSIMSGAMPVYILFFPVMFAFVQAATPLASFNYGAKQFVRVRRVYWWTIIYSGFSAVIIYFLVAFGISGPLINLLKVDDGNVIKSYNISIDALKIVMLSMITFVFGIAAMVIFSSTDRIMFSLISSSLRGLILFWFVIYPFKVIAINNTDNNVIFFWYPTVLSALASFVTSIMVFQTLWILNKKYQRTLDERIDSIYDIQHFYKLRRLAYKNAKKNGNLNKVKLEWRQKNLERKNKIKETNANKQKEVDIKYAEYKAKKQAIKH